MAGKRNTPAKAGQQAAAPAAPAPTAPPSVVVDSATAPGAALQPGEVLGQLAGVQLQNGTMIQLADLPEPELRKLANDLQIEIGDGFSVEQLVAAIQAEQVVIPAAGTELVPGTDESVGPLDGGTGKELTPSTQPETGEPLQPSNSESLDQDWLNVHRIPAVRIRSADRQGLRRAGRRFGPEWQTIPLAELDDDQAEALAKEPGLVIEATYVDPAELS